MPTWRASRLPQVPSGLISVMPQACSMVAPKYACAFSITTRGTAVPPDSTRFSFSPR